MCSNCKTHLLLDSLLLTRTHMFRSCPPFVHTVKTVLSPRSNSNSTTVSWTLFIKQHCKVGTPLTHSHLAALLPLLPKNLPKQTQPLQLQVVKLTLESCPPRQKCVPATLSTSRIATSTPSTTKSYAIVSAATTRLMSRIPKSASSPY